MERSEIKQEYKWNLSDIYINYDKWNEDFNNIQNLHEELMKYKGSFSDKDKFHQYLKKAEEFEKLSYKLFSYPSLAKDLNSDDKEAVDHYQIIINLFSKFNTDMSWVTPEIIENKNKIQNWIENLEQFSEYKFSLESLFRQQEHVLNENDSRLLSYFSPVFSGISDIYSNITVADMEWETVELTDGRNVELTPANYAKEMEFAKKQEDRKRMFQVFYKMYEKRKNSIASVYKKILEKNVASSKAHKYESVLSSFLKGKNISEDVYLNLINTTKKYNKPLQRRVKIRKKILGLETYYNYDESVSLVNFEKEYEYENAKNIVLNSVKPLGEEYVKRMEKALSNGWIDVFETKGKRTGAYSAGIYGVHPYMLLNYNKTMDSVFTLAHELGHTLHTMYSDENQPFENAHYTIFVAEVASTFNERLLLDYMIENSNDPLEKIKLLEQEIDNIIGTFYTQVLFANYEYNAHQLAFENQPITADSLSNIFDELYEEYYGSSITRDELFKYIWTRVPHFYGSPFYVYQYATSFAASAILYNKIIIEKDKEALDKYIELLKSGGNDYPMNQLKKAGVDLTKVETIVAVTERLDNLLDKLEIEIQKIK